MLSELECLLAPLDEQRLRAALARYASGLPTAARAGFLVDLAAACAPAGSAAPDDTELISAIEAFVADAESGMYCDGWGWDPEVRHERAFGDDSWAPRMDDLFARAADVFLAGRHALSAEVHRRLFAALALEGEEGPVYSCEFSPSESLNTDLVEAGARWLRSLYEIAAGPAQAAAALAQAWQAELPFGRQPRSLAAVRETLPEDLGDFDAFLPYWTRELVDRSGDRDRLRGELLKEASRLCDDTAPLREAAQHHGPGQPQAYLDLVEALTARGDQPAALQACSQGLQIAESPGADRAGWAACEWAPLADRAARLCDHHDHEAVVGFRLRAFALGVSTARLVALYLAAEAHRPGTGPQASRAAADRLAGGGTGLASWHLDGYRAQALLLAGRVDDALELLAASDPASHGHSRTVLTVLPYVLAASSDATSHRDWPNTALHALFGQTPYAGRTLSYDDGLDVDGTASLTELLERLLHQRPACATDRDRWRRACRTVIDQWTRSVLGGKQRTHYGDVARLAAAITEAEILTGGASNYLDGLLDTHKRFTAFRREADAARRASVLL